MNLNKKIGEIIRVNIQVKEKEGWGGKYLENQIWDLKSTTSKIQARNLTRQDPFSKQRMSNPLNISSGTIAVPFLNTPC
jgi:hypothetical protein